MKNPLVAAVIPTYNEAKDIENCIKTLLTQSYKPFEVIFVDDDSTDSTIEIIKKYPVKLFQQSHKGPGLARNLGVSKTKAEIIVFIDADMEFHPDYIKNLVKPILEKKTIGTNHEEELILNKNNIWAKCWGRRITTFKGEFAIFRAILKKEFDKVQGFDPEQGYADDQSLVKKLNKRPILAKNTICYHKNPSNLKEVFRQSRWIGASLNYKFLNIPLLNIFFIAILSILAPIKILQTTFNKIYTEKYISYLYYYPIFGIFKYYGNISGLLNKILLNKNTK